MSIFAIHNETGNIWSHLFGVIIYGILVIIYGILGIQLELSKMRFGERIVFGIYCSCACVGFFSSALYHICVGTTPQIVLATLKLDYIGIIVFTGAAFNSIAFYNFYCNMEIYYS